MSSKNIIIVAVIALILGYLLGYEAHTKKDDPLGINSTATKKTAKFYRHPMNPEVISDHPQKDDMGMEYIAVYNDSSTGIPKRVLFYRNPMNPEVTSSTPMQDAMGMDYIPVYADESSEGRAFQLSPEKIQKLGVKSEEAKAREILKVIQTVGSIEADESLKHVVSPRFEGWINRLIVNTTGAPVKKGQPLLELYSPSVLTSEEEYLVAKSNQNRLDRSSSQSRDVASELTHSALERLRLWNIPEAEIRRLQSSNKASSNITLLSPTDGVITDKPSVEGMRFMPGEVLYKIANLESVWLVAEIFEQDMAEVKVGQISTLSVNSYPDHAFQGKVTFISPYLNPETRTIRVRIQMANPKGLLKPAMYGNVALEGVTHHVQAAIPESAILDSGLRKVAFVMLSGNKFEARELSLGVHGNGYVEVLSGLTAGERVVTSGNFLIDAESNLRAAVRGMEGQRSSTEDEKAHTTPNPSGGGH